MTKISFVKSVLCALRGLYCEISRERNIKIQIILGIFLIFTALVLDISKVYLITIIIICFLVVILELFNMTFEKLLDVIFPKYNKKVGEIKDTMAGIVLLIFGLAALVSFLILYEPVFYILKMMLHNQFSLGLIMGNIFLLCIILIIDYAKHQT